MEEMFGGVLLVHAVGEIGCECPNQPFEMSGERRCEGLHWQFQCVSVDRCQQLNGFNLLEKLRIDKLKVRRIWLLESLK